MVLHIFFYFTFHHVYAYEDNISVHSYHYRFTGETDCGSGYNNRHNNGVGKHALRKKHGYS